MDSQNSYWRKCSSCKKEIALGATYQLCSVSTCRGKRTGYVFCSVPCWDAHVGIANHRSASAEEERAPLVPDQEEEMSDTPQQPKRVIIRPNVNAEDYKTVVPVNLMEVETLVVISKVKKLIRDQADFNTSQCAVDALTQKVVSECLKAIEAARADGRKTVMGRDFV